MRDFPLNILPDPDEPEAAEILVSGDVGGRAYTFLLDTGAGKSTILLDEYTAGFAGAGTHSASGVFAARSEALISVPSIRLGPIFQRDFTLTRSAAPHPGQSNLIGMDLLKEHRLHFLFDENRVEVDADLEDGVPLRDLFLDAKAHPYVDVGLGAANAAAVWDTGAGITVVDLGLIAQHPTFFEPVGQSYGTDATGTGSDTPTYRMHSAVIGGQVFPPHAVAGVDLSRVNATVDTPFQLILGYSTLRHANWVFDFPGRRWGITKMLGR